MTILLLVAAALVIFAIAGSITLAVTDGYRRIPADRA